MSQIFHLQWDVEWGWMLRGALAQLMLTWSHTLLKHNFFFTTLDYKMRKEDRPVYPECWLHWHIMLPVYLVSGCVLFALAKTDIIAVVCWKVFPVINCKEIMYNSALLKMSCSSSKVRKNLPRFWSKTIPGQLQYLESQTQENGIFVSNWPHEKAQDNGLYKENTRKVKHVSDLEWYRTKGC